MFSKVWGLEEELVGVRVKLLHYNVPTENSHRHLQNEPACATRLTAMLTLAVMAELLLASLAY